MIGSWPLNTGPACSAMRIRLDSGQARGLPVDREHARLKTQREFGAVARRLEYDVQTVAPRLAVERLDRRGLDLRGDDLEEARLEERRVARRAGG